MNRHESRKQRAIRRKRAEGATKRYGTIAANDFKIRALKYEWEEAQQPDDCLVLVLDLDDPYAKKIYESLNQLPDGGRLGQSPRPDDTLQLAAVPYSLFRVLLSANHRGLFDACPRSSIRVAFLSEGRTMDVVLPGEPGERSPVIFEGDGP